MSNATVIGIGLVLMLLGAFLFGTRFESTNTDRGVTYVIDRWTGDVKVCQMSLGCKPVSDVDNGKVRP